MPPEPRYPLDRWEALVDFAGDGELDRIDALTPDQVEAELAAAGLGKGDPRFRRVPAAVASGPDAVPPSSASAPDLAHSLDLEPKPPSAGAPVIPITSRWRRFSPFGRIPFVYAAAAVIFAVLMGYAVRNYVENRHVADPNHPDPTVPHVTPAPEGPGAVDPVRQGKILLEQAKQACAKADWTTCQARVAQAVTADNALLDDAEWKALREQSNNAIVEQEKRIDHNKLDPKAPR
jgi:hypothetical protein